MQTSDIPLRLPVPFASSAGGSYVRTIPETSQIGVHDGWASLPDGFPPLTATPIASGGVPPDVRDINGILFELSAWARWVAAGGVAPYDATFSGKIGGYPKWAMLASTVTTGLYWISTANNNTTDPDGGSPANWVRSDNAATLNGQAGSYYTNIVARLGYTPLNAASYTASDVLGKLLSVDGAGSGLDADLLDGFHAASFLLVSAYTAADVLAKIKTVDGAGSGLDADLLDALDWVSGQNVSFGQGLFQTPNLGATGGLRLLANAASALAILQVLAPGGGSEWGHWTYTASGQAIWTGPMFANGSALVWNAANDGSGSGLDADVLRGLHWQSGQDVRFGQVFAQTPNAGSSGGFRLKGNPTSGLAFFQVVDNTETVEWGNWAFAPGGFAQWSGALHAHGTSGGALVWDAANDGSGSGLDADLLDGLDGSQYSRIVSSNLSTVNGSRVSSDGFKQCWGAVDVPPNGGVVFISIPTPHSSFFFPTLGAFTKNSASSNRNTALYATDRITYFAIQNWEDVTMTCFWHTDGV